MANRALPRLVKMWRVTVTAHRVGRHEILAGVHTLPAPTAEIAATLGLDRTYADSGAPHLKSMKATSRNHLTVHLHREEMAFDEADRWQS